MHNPFRKPAILLLAFTGVALACSGNHYRLKGEEIGPGVYQVYSASGFWPLPDSSVQWRSEGISRVADFKAQMDSLISVSNLVFVGSIDTVVGDGLHNAAEPAGIVPQTVLLRSTASDTTYGRFYARLKVDTLIKGTLPSSLFWFVGYGYGSSCNVNLQDYRGGRFLNYSNAFTNMSDLKMPRYSSFCVNCPTAHWFDGRYLRSPDFPVLALDIREVLPGFPVSLQGATPRVQVPLRRDGKRYSPDGRIVPEKSVHKRTVPALRSP